MNGNMEIASSKLAEFIGKGDLTKGMVNLKRKKSGDSKRNFANDFKAEKRNCKSEL